MAHAGSAVARFTGSELMCVCILGFRYALPQALCFHPLSRAKAELKGDDEEIEFVVKEEFEVSSFRSLTSMCLDGLRATIIGNTARASNR
jgi:hypothetical protein